MAPVYFTGTFGNYTYNDTYIASTGVDIAGRLNIVPAGHPAGQNDGFKLCHSRRT
jgi:hypothetical protein